MLWLPLVALAPLQLPVALQAVAFDELHVKVDAPPLVTTVGEATNVARGMTFRVTEAGALTPSGPLQVKEYEVGTVTAPVLWAPPIDFVPLQPPDAVQAVALAEVHVSVEAPPLATARGATVKVTLGRALTVTVTAAAALLPPVPVQVIEYVVVAVRGAVLREPLGFNEPAQPPEAVHAVAPMELQVNVDVPPGGTTPGFAVSVAVGAGMTRTAAVATLLLPSAPVQVSEKVESAVMAAVLWLPLVANAPVQPPVATHDVALVEVHVNVLDAPAATASGAAVNDAVGGDMVVGVVPRPPQAASTRLRPRGRQYLAVMNANFLSKLLNIAALPDLEKYLETRLISAA